MEKNKGITLVALVITIIITLVLAGVAVSLITEENNLYGKANTAATKYTNSLLNEAERLNSLNSFLNGNYNEIESDTKEEEWINLNNDEFDENVGHNKPDTIELTSESTKYVIWEKMVKHIIKMNMKNHQTNGMIILTVNGQI